MVRPITDALGRSGRCPVGRHVICRRPARETGEVITPQSSTTSHRVRRVAKKAARDGHIKSGIDGEKSGMHGTQSGNDGEKSGMHGTKAASMAKKAPRMKVEGINDGEKSGTHAAQSAIDGEKSGIACAQSGNDGEKSGMHGTESGNDDEKSGIVAGRSAARLTFSDTRCAGSKAADGARVMRAGCGA